MLVAPLEGPRPSCSSGLPVNYELRVACRNSVLGVRVASASIRRGTMFPLGDDNSQRRTFPIVTLALIALNVLVFLVELNAGQAFIQQWAFVPRRFAADPMEQVHTIFTGMFMHGGWLHLFGNMLYLWIFGDNVEDEIGSFKFLVFYLLCGVAATLAQFYVSTPRTSPTWAPPARLRGYWAPILSCFPTRGCASSFTIRSWLSQLSSCSACG